MTPADAWVRLHPLSPLLESGKVMVLGGFLALRLWADNAAETGGALTPGLRLVLFALGAIVLGGLLAFAYAFVSWRFRAYRVTDTLVEHRAGILFRTHRQLPFDRVESVDTAQPLVPRALGLAEVRVHAVSKSDQELRLRFLTLADAVVLREQLAARSRSAPAPGEPTIAPTVPILQVPVRELVLGYGVPPVARVAVFILSSAVLLAVLAGPAAALGVAFAGVFLVLASLFSAALRIERLWGFRLDDGPEALVIHRGLANLNTQRIHTGRVQAIRIDQPLLWRPFGRFRLVVDVASHRGANREAAAAAGELLPIAPEAVVRYALQRLEFRADLDTLDYVGVPPRARWRSRRWRSFEMATTPTHLVVRSGVLWRRTAIVRKERLQSARVTQGPWQRRLRLASLHVDTAGPRVAVIARHRDVGEAAASAVDLAGAVTAGR